MLLLLTGLTGVNSRVIAMPVGGGLFCAASPEAPACSGSAISCTYCHQSVPPLLNAYGTDLSNFLGQDKTFPLDLAAFNEMLSGTAQLDSDQDGIVNGEEILTGSLPGNGDDRPLSSSCAQTGCAIDPNLVYQRIWIGVCGEPVSFDDLETFSKLSTEEKDLKLHDTLDLCLDSENWIGKDGVVWELGHYKIRPVGSVKFGEDAGIVPIVDYYNDYQIFVYTQIDGNDARNILLADYTVSRAIIGGRTFYNKETPSRVRDGQVMQPAYRIGLLTTFWNMGFYLNFTPVARVLVAQAFNAYLGINLSLMQGINPVPTEDSKFRDYDLKGVERPECARCHTTIDPLAYPFRNYNGLTGTRQVLAGQNAEGLTDLAKLGSEENLTPLSYALPRMEFLDQKFPGIKDMPEAGYIFGKRVENLHEWAEVLVNSDPFAANTVMDYWKILIGGEPTQDQTAEFKMLWTNFKEKHSYSVEAMLHELIKTQAFGAP